MLKKTSAFFAFSLLSAMSYGSPTDVSAALKECYASSCLNLPANGIGMEKLCNSTQQLYERLFKAAPDTPVCQNFVLATALHCEARACIPSVTTHSALNSSIKVCLSGYASQSTQFCPKSH